MDVESTVCAWCEREGLVAPAAPGEIRSHGICERHLKEELSTTRDNVEKYPLLGQQRHFRRSACIGELALALAKAQGEIKSAQKDSANPFYHSKYADLASVWLACRKALSSVGICIMQFPRRIEAGIEVETILAHGGSGEWVAETLSLPASILVKNKEGNIVERFDAQTIGSAITYARRYTLAAIVGVAPDDDDDGNAAAASSENNRALLSQQAMNILSPAANKGTAELELAWKTISQEMRLAVKDRKESLKEIALAVDENGRKA